MTAVRVCCGPGSRPDANLASLAAAVDAALEPLGIPARNANILSAPDARAIRIAARSGRRCDVAINKAGRLEFGSATAKEFHLYQSVLKSGGAEYTRLATFFFAGSESRVNLESLSGASI